MIANRVGIKTFREGKRMRDILSELFRAGELIRLRQGVYGLAPKGNQSSEIREVMWRVLRMRRAVTVDDLREMAGASEAYAKDWLRMLADKELVRKEGKTGCVATWRLITDPVEMPVDDGKAAKLRRLRERRALVKARDMLDQVIAGYDEA
jgi:hypothetical protein